jgi:hypothetical protein
MTGSAEPTRIEITKSRLHHVNMGNYESVEVFASIKIESGGKPGDVELATIMLDEALDIITAPDLEDARINTDEEKSYIHPYLDDLNTRSTRAAH